MTHWPTDLEVKRFKIALILEDMSAQEFARKQNARPTQLNHLLARRHQCYRLLEAMRRFTPEVLRRHRLTWRES